MRKEIGIKAYHWALGDSIQFSTLPEIFSKMGYDVYLLPDASFKNQEIKDLVWMCNPYIKGEKNIEWSLGDIPGRAYENRSENFIKNWEISHGIDPENEFPKIYYTPRKIDGVDIIIDISAQSVTYNIPLLVSEIRNFISKNYPNSKCQLITSRKFPVNDNFGFDLIEAENLKHYVDLINSCNVFISCSSGGHSLAASIRHINKEFRQICFLPERIETDSQYCPTYDYLMETKRFIYPLVEYIKI
jgi:hypothetical protein